MKGKRSKYRVLFLANDCGQLIMDVTLSISSSDTRLRSKISMIHFAVAPTNAEVLVVVVISVDINTPSERFDFHNY